MTVALAFDPEGTVETVDVADPLEWARANIAPFITVVAAHLMGLDPGAYVIVIDDYGRMNSQPINRRAWALYGASPIYGRALFYRDDHADLEPALVEHLSGPNFPTDRLNAAMTAWLIANPEAGT